jgi:hypothetical protein
MTTAINPHDQTLDDSINLAADNFEVFIGIRNSSNGDIFTVPPRIGKVVATQTTKLAPSLPAEEIDLEVFTCSQ